jgi:hypothetical protein
MAAEERKQPEIGTKVKADGEQGDQAERARESSIEHHGVGYPGDGAEIEGQPRHQAIEKPPARRNLRKDEQERDESDPRQALQVCPGKSEQEQGTAQGR